jgi:YggT family protein
MTYEEERVVTRSDEYTNHPHAHGVSESRVAYRSNPMLTVERFIVFVFGVIQAVILLRIIFLLLAAREANDIVQFVYGLSEVFVAPFRGILGIDEVAAGQAALDLGAIVALIGWTILELLALALVRVFRPTATA